MAEKKYSIILAAADKTRAAFDTANRNIETMTGGLFSLHGILGTVSAVGMAAMIKSSIDGADKLGDLSKATKISVEQLAGLKMASAQSGTDLDAVAKSINKLSQNMGLNAEKYAALGINSTDKLEAYKQFADVFNRIADVHERDAFASAALGKNWAEVAPLLSEGGDAIGEMVTKGSKLSGVTGDMADKADQFNDRMSELKTVAEGVGNRLAIALLPTMNGVSKAFIDVASNEETMAQASEVLSGIIKTLSSAALGAAHIFSDLGGGIGAVAAAAVAAATGDFSGAAKILELRRADVLKDEAVFAERLNKIWNTAAEAPRPKHAAVSGGAAPNVSGFLTDGANEKPDKFAEDDLKWFKEYSKQTNTMVEKQQERFLALSQAAEESDATEAEREQLKVERQLSDLERQRMIMATDHALTLGEIASFEQAKLDIERRSNAAKTQMGKAAFIQDLATLGKESAIFMTAYKIAAVAEIMAAGGVRAEKSAAWAATWGGPIAAAAAFGISWAATIANAAMVSGLAGGGGGGGAGSGMPAGSGAGGDTSTYPYAPEPMPIAAKSSVMVNINLGDGGMFSASAVRALMEQINEQIADGATINQIRVN